MLDKAFPLYIAVFLLSLLITAMITKRIIPVFRRTATQPIYEEGPRWHMSKSGTPTMGGLAFLIGCVVSLLSASFFTAAFGGKDTLLSILLSLGFALSNSAVGILDDLKKLHRKENHGLSPKEKLVLQFLIASLFLTLRAILLDNGTSISFSFGEVDLGFLYYPISIITAVGIINCANLTDGIDGLASSVAFSIGVTLLYISAALNTETGLLASAIIGSAVGFLIFNLHPAKIFMGDTGSLFFGSLIASTAFTLNNPIILIAVSGVYILEGVSVILQVLSFKLTRRRIFKMAPIHHHLEECGWSENKICIVAMLCTFIFSVPAYIFYLP